MSVDVSLGALLKYYRIKRRVSQLEIAYMLGWTDTSRLSRIEQERILRPSRELVNRIAHILGLDEIERNELLYAGKYKLTDDEVLRVRNELRPFLIGWNGPAFLMDFTWKLLDFNEVGAKFFGINPKEVKRIKGSKPNLLELFFSPHFIPKVWKISWNDKKWLMVLESELSEFKQDHHDSLGEKWVEDLVKKLSKFEHFMEMWRRVHSGTTSIVLNRYSLIEFSFNSQTAKFHKFIPQYARDRRVYLVLYLAANEEASKFLRSLTK